MQQKKIQPLLFESETEAYFFGKQFDEAVYKRPLTNRDLCTLAMGFRGVNYIDKGGEKQVLLSQNLEGFDECVQIIQESGNSSNFKRETLKVEPLGIKESNLDGLDYRAADLLVSRAVDRLDEAIKGERNALAGPLKSRVRVLKEHGEKPLSYLDAWRDTSNLLTITLMHPREVQKTASKSESVKQSELNWDGWDDSVVGSKNSSVSDQSRSRQEIEVKSSLNEVETRVIDQAPAFYWEESNANKLLQKYNGIKNRSLDRLSSNDLETLALGSRGIEYNSQGSDIVRISEPDPGLYFKVTEEIGRRQESAEKQKQEYAERESQGKSDVVHGVIQTVAGIGLILAGIIAGILLMPIMGPLSWLPGGLAMAAGGAMAIDGLRDNRDHDRAESYAQDGPSAFRDVPERPTRGETPKSSIAPSVSLEASPQADNQADIKIGGPH